MTTLINFNLSAQKLKLPFKVIITHYDIDVNKEYVIRGNAGILKCQTPSFVADYLQVIAWHTDSNETFGLNDTTSGSETRRLIIPLIHESFPNCLRFCLNYFH